MKEYQRVQQAQRDTWAHDYERWFARNKGTLFDELERGLFVQFVQGTGARLVGDVGCGTGRITESIAAHVGRVAGLDYSHQSLRLLAQKQVENAFTVVANVSASWPFPAGTFDLLLSCQVFQALQGPEVLEALREARRTTSPGGRFALSVYNLSYWRYRGIVELGESGGTRLFSSAYIKYIAKKTGWRVDRISYYRALPLRIFRRRPWLVADRLLSAIPGLRRTACAYLFVVLERD